MKNVFIEGIPGMGKSTLLNRISTAIPQFKNKQEEVKAAIKTTHLLAEK